MRSILLVIGSLRKNSFNRQLAQVISSELAGKATVSTLRFDDIPYMNQDIEWPAPETVRRVRETVAAADGVWIVTPEYKKKVTISGAGGKNATANSRARLTELLEFMRTDVMPGGGTGVAVNMDAFKTDKVVFTEEQLCLLHEQVEAFLAFLG